MSDGETPTTAESSPACPERPSGQQCLPDHRDPRFGVIEEWIKSDPPELQRARYIIWTDESGIFAFFPSTEGIVFYLADPTNQHICILDRKTAYDKLFDLICEVRVRTKRKLENQQEWVHKRESLRLHEVMRMIFQQYIEDYDVERHIRRKYGIKRSPTGTRRMPVLPDALPPGGGGDQKTST